MKPQYGKWNLLKKTFAIISASIAAFGNNAQATDTNLVNNNREGPGFENFKKNTLKPKLILKLSSSNIDESKIMMHTSHSSHRSHSSHSSHASHSSHYSSSSSNIPSPTPTYKPTVIPSNNPKVTPENKTVLSYPKDFITNDSTVDHRKITLPITKNGNEILFYALGSRILFKGCRGTDVKELQELLITQGYEITASGIFDEITRIAVIDFQKLNYLDADGRVGPKTLFVLKGK